MQKFTTAQCNNKNGLKKKNNINSKCNNHTNDCQFSSTAPAWSIAEFANPGAPKENAFNHM